MKHLERPLDAAEWIAKRFEGATTLDGGVELVRDRLASAEGALRVRKWARSVDERQALARERSELLRLRHPSLRELVASGESDRASVAILEHVQGRDLSEHLKREPGSIVACATGLLRAMVHLHAKGVVHGDLKPANVLV